MTGKWFVRAAVTALLATSAVAQMRMPCTGVVRDADGKPLANALVVADWQPDEVVFGPPDRHETRTDAEGKFAFELWIGHEYCTWVIGPADADKSRLVVPPRWCAVGGKQLELVARVRTSPVRLDVRGTTAWLPDGPLALRVFVANGAALPDFPIPGDGLVSLPPLPTTRFAIALVDGRGQVLDSVMTDADDKAPCTFAPVQDTEFLVVDERDQPVAGAAVWSSTWVCTPQPSPRDFIQGMAEHRRVVATSTANGRARGRFVRRKVDNEQVLFHASDATRFSRVAGWISGERFEDSRGSAAEDEDQLTFVLRNAEVRSVQFASDDEGVLWHVDFPAGLRWRGRTVIGSVTIPAPGVAEPAGVWSARVPDNLVHSVPKALPQPARLRGTGTGPLPVRAIALPHATFDPTQLRRIAIRIVGTDAEPVPFARVWLQHGQSAILIHLVTDAAGRCDVLDLPGKGYSPYTVRATTETAHGQATVDTPRQHEVTVLVVPKVIAWIRVVDANDKPVAGAFLTSWPNAGKSRPLHFSNPLCGAITDANGEVRVPVPLEFDGTCLVHATARQVRSEPVTLRVDTSEPVILRLPQ